MQTISITKVCRENYHAIRPTGLVVVKSKFNKECSFHESIFDRFTLKDVTVRNRIAVSPMCQYSAVDGFVNDWHFVHLGSKAIGGAGIVTVEATGVTPEGRISPGCTGIWSDDHIPGLKHIAGFLKAHGSVAAIQIAHAGRKASANKPWEGDDHLEPSEGAWQTIAPSSLAFGANLPVTPREMTLADISAVKAAFVAGAKRSLEAGFEWLELHFAHGYLAHEFYSPLSNHRTDQYGGSFDNRTRFMMETLEAVRAVWPERFPLTARLSVTDWTEGGVTIEESIELTKRFKANGLDLLDVSQGFVIPDISRIPWGPGFMIPFSSQIRRETGLPTSVGWMISDPKQANEAIKQGDADIIMLAREFLRDPQWPFHAAQQLGIETPQNLLPIQYGNWLKR